MPLTPPEVDKMRLELEEHWAKIKKLRQSVLSAELETTLQKLHFITRSIDSSGARWG